MGAIMAPRPGSTLPPQGGKGGVQPPVQPQVPAQGGKGNMPLPAHYQSPYANYGFDSGLQSYLDQQNFRSATDAGVAFQYDPTNQTFTGGTMGGTYNPIPLSVMQQAAGGNRDVLNPYFQSRFPQPTGPVPTVKPGLTPQRPIIDPRNPIRGLGSYNPVMPTRPTFDQIANDPRRSKDLTGAVVESPMFRPQVQPQPANPQKGLGGLQLDKFKRRLG